MTQEKKRASAAANGFDALENVTHCPAINGFESTQNLRAIQVQKLVRRHRLSPSRARVVAGLLFTEARA